MSSSKTDSCCSLSGALRIHAIKHNLVVADVVITADRNHQHCEPVEGWMFECANSLFERLIERADKDEAERQLFVALYITPRRIGMVLQIVDSIQVQGDGLDIVRHNAELIAQIRRELRPGEAVERVHYCFTREMRLISISDTLSALTV